MRRTQRIHTILERWIREMPLVAPLAMQPTDFTEERYAPSEVKETFSQAFASDDIIYGVT